MPVLQESKASGANVEVPAFGHDLYSLSSFTT